MEKLKNYINGQWVESHSDHYVGCPEPCQSGTCLHRCLMVLRKMWLMPRQPLMKVFRNGEILRFPNGSNILFKLKTLLEDNLDDIARTITLESGKTFIEAKAEMVRAIENVENACGMPTLIQGQFSEDIAKASTNT